MKFTLQINDPKTGWAHAEETECLSADEAYELAAAMRAERKRLQFGLQVQVSPKQGKLFMLKDSTFIGVSDNQPLWLWLTQFGITEETL